MIKKWFLVFVLLTTQIFGKSALDNILRRGELRVGLEPGYLPFEMKDKKGKIIGFDVDIANAMAKSMGVKLKLVPTAWDGIIAGLLTNKYDIIMGGMTITQKRNLKVMFSEPYIVVGQTLLVKKSLARKIKNYKQLDSSRYKVTTKLGTTGEIAARKFFKKAKIATFETEAEAAIEVLNGKADAFIFDQPFNTVFMAKQGKGRVVHLDKPLTYEPLGWAIRRGDPDFLNFINHFLNQIKNDNVSNQYNKWYRKWFIDTKWLNRLN